jgi:hypothetical protein
MKEMVLSMDLKLISNFSILSEDNINAEHANLISNFLPDSIFNTDQSKSKKIDLKKKRKIKKKKKSN